MWEPLLMWWSWGCTCLAAPPSCLLGVMWQCGGVVLVWWGSSWGLISLSSHLQSMMLQCGVVILVQWGILLSPGHNMAMWERGGHSGLVGKQLGPRMLMVSSPGCNVALRGVILCYAPYSLGNIWGVLVQLGVARQTST